MKKFTASSTDRSNGERRGFRREDSRSWAGEGRFKPSFQDENPVSYNTLLHSRWAYQTYRGAVVVHNYFQQVAELVEATKGSFVLNSPLA